MIFSKKARKRQDSVGEFESTRLHETLSAVRFSAVRFSRPGVFSKYRKENGFTLIELIVVVLVIGVAATFLSLRGGVFRYYKEEAFIRRLSETLTFLHHRAVADGVDYHLQFHMEVDEPSYSVREVVPAGSTGVNTITNFDPNAILTQELALRLTPVGTGEEYMIEPRNFPSMAKPVPLPSEAFYNDVRTMRGVFTESIDDVPPSLRFHKLGFSEFGVIHIEFAEGRQVTILVNPFTGIPSIYRDYRDFEWTYGRDKK